MAPTTGVAFPVSAGIVIPPATSGAFQLPNLNSTGTSGGGRPPLQPLNLQPLPSSPEETSGKPSKKAIMKWESWKVLVLIEIMREEFIAAKGKEGRECMDRSEQKWKRIERKMHAQGIEAEFQQLCKTSGNPFTGIGRAFKISWPSLAGGITLK
ncbi:hypothetical protein R1flu_018101 [Riccia fluitans]|uniref:Regulatory protein zeste n=1 Tax=Riccia fluitans TaxID=41844 RepID=A0ABD1ZEV3_9MARC